MDFDKINEFRDENKRQAERKQDHDVIKKALENVDKTIKHQTAKSTAERKSTTYKTKNVDPIASPKDIEKVVEALNDVIVSQEMSKEDLADSLKDVAAGLLNVADEVSTIPKQYPKFPEFPEFPEFPDSTKVDNLKEIKPWLDEVAKAIDNLEVNPQVNIEQPDINVTQAKIDITPITKGLQKIEKSLANFKVPETDLTELLKATRGTTKAINSLTFPVPNYVLPFARNTDGAARQATVIESTDVPGVWGVVVLNADGSSVSTGTSGPGVGVDNLLLTSGTDNLLLTSGSSDVLLLT